MQQLGLESFKALGLLRAMYVIPVLGVVLAAILFTGSRTVGKDVGRLGTLFRGDSAL